ncbi:MAG: glutamine--fructose-6-phosphate transaminase (isomerizing) [Desulfobacteraceae bacterium]|nr:MAG: glutamine--fructose-6-phosphate transaminase (isomerizing) [Desulfobacteraceae bacterium]
MCGIVGYIGKRNGAPYLIEGLKRLEYRGYDSAGIAYLQRSKIKVIKKQGKIANLEKILPKTLSTHVGIAHTRWATHGEVNDANAHPHLSMNAKVAVIHNGIIDNYAIIKKSLEKEGYVFQSQTDTEVLANLIEKHLTDNPEQATQTALHQITGTYGIAVLFKDFPDCLIGARNGSPLVMGLGQEEMFLASDPNAILGHTRQAIYLDDGEMVVLTHNDYKILTLENKEVHKTVEKIEWAAEEMEKGSFPHFMLKEIFEQPEAVQRAYAHGGRLVPDFGTAKLGGLNLSSSELLQVQQIRLIAMGTAYYASMIGAYLLESLARLPAVAEQGAELRYRNPVVEKDCLYLAVSQSGETIDVLGAMKEIQNRGARVLGICNMVGSTIARESNGGVYIHAGPEIAVASTKAFTSQITILLLLSLLLGRMKHLPLSRGKQLIQELVQVPDKMQQLLAKSEEIRTIALKYKDAKNMLYLGRGINYPVALEGALKLKEISYIHAEGFAAGDIKHGPLALVCEETPSVFILARGETHDKVIANIQEVKARKGRVLVVANFMDSRLETLADDLILVPETKEELSPLLTVIPLQLMAYYIAEALGRDIDQPRNLAKSVTVE